MINFSGVWVLNLAKSQLQSPPPESSVFKISHSGQTFCLDRTHVINGINDEFIIELVIDSVTTRKNLSGVDILAKMYWDGETLVFDSLFQQGDEEATNIVKYAITEEGHTLVAEEDFISREHKHHNIWVFEKKTEKKG